MEVSHERIGQIMNFGSGFKISWKSSEMGPNFTGLYHCCEQPGLCKNLCEIQIAGKCEKVSSPFTHPLKEIKKKRIINNANTGAPQAAPPGTSDRASSAPNNLCKTAPETQTF